MAFKIFMVYHSHIDIGYTERQEKMTVYQSDFINQAVNYAISEKQEGRAGDHKFKFTAEGFWAVEKFLEKYGEEGLERLKAAVKSGMFELTGCYFHMAELLNYDNIKHSLNYVQDFSRKNNFPQVKAAMASDINGFSWGFSDALYESGVRYLATNINTHHGGAPFGKPMVPFYWETPLGRKILVWNGLTYHKANLLGLIPGLTPIGDPGIPGMLVEESGFIDVCNTDYAHKRIFAMVDGFKKNGYPYDFTAIMGSALYTDNSPCGDEHCELIKEWNEKYGDEIEIVTSTLEEFFEYMESNLKNIETYRGDWNDWWTDGVLSTPNETKLFRNAQRVQELIKKLDPDMKIISEDEHEAISNKLITYSEHTWGHSASYSDPCRLLVAQLDARKAKLAFDADVLACTAWDKLSRDLGEGEFKHRRPFEYTVINPSDQKRNEAVCLYTDFWEDGLFQSGEYKVVDEKGNELAFQRTYALRGAVIFCNVELEPKETKILKIVFEKGNSINQSRLDCDKCTYENDFFKLSYGENGIYSIIHKGSGEELIDTKDYLFGAPVYQVFYNGNRGDAAGFGYGKRKKPLDTIYKGRINNFFVKESGDIFTQFRAEIEIEGAKRVNVEYFVYNNSSKIDVRVEMAKELVMDPEGMYVAFPFKIKNGCWMLDKAGAYFAPGEQLPSTCCDYYPVCRGVVLSGDNLGISVNTLDTPLIAIGRIKLWDFTTAADTEGTLFSWITNNKWETNFRSQCSGTLESRYVIDFSEKMKNAENGLDFLEKNEHEVVVLRH